MSITEIETMEEVSNEQTPLQNISLLNSGLTTKEQLKICCKPTYKIRRLKNKGAILILVWSYLIFGILFISEIKQFMKLQLVALGVTLPIAGWLADVYFGRYVVIQFSMWTMWIAVMLATASSVVARFVESYTNIDCYVYDVLMIVAMIGLGAFQANIIQFGADQLHDASTNEITSFISWYVWTNFVTGYIVFVVLECINNKYRTIINLVVMCIHVIAAIVSMFLFSHLLVKEPVTKNPFKLVYNVVKYAIKNKHPRRRSAFTYCEDDLPSRIDFGKSKYGGPFTTEQVEDVKTFLRLLAPIAVGSVAVSEVWGISSELLLTTASVLYNTTVTKEVSVHQCYLRGIFLNTVNFSGVLLIPMYEFLFFPLFHRFLTKINSQRKFILGVLLLISVIVTVMGFEAVTNYNSPKSNKTATMYNSTDNTALDYKWLAIPSFLDSMSVALLLIGAIEFIISQAPYFMRGLIMGTAYGMWALSSAVVVAIRIPLPKRLSTGVINNGLSFWYVLLLLITELLAGMLLILTMRWYKKRKREDVLPNEHIFAERYYERET